MILAKVVGTVVCTHKVSRLEGKTLQVVQPYHLKTMVEDGKPLVAIDVMGAGEGEMVLVVSGSSARQTEHTKDTPVDAVIMGIVDEVRWEDQQVFQKSESPSLV